MSSTRALVPAFLARILVCLAAARSGAFPAEPSLPYDLGTVLGMEAFPEDPTLRESLSRRGFAVVPRYHRQIFLPYRSETAPYITPESAIRGFQCLLNEGLRRLELGRIDGLRRTLDRLHAAASSLSVPEGAWADARRRLLAWCEAPRILLRGRRNLGFSDRSDPSHVRDAARLAAEEIACVERGGLGQSPILLRELPYGAIGATSYYAPDPRLARYSRATGWLGLADLASDIEMDCRMMVLLGLAAARDRRIAAGLRELSAPLDELLGPPDDATLEDVDGILRVEGLGAPVGPSAPDLDSLLGTLREGLAKLPEPAIRDRRDGVDGPVPARRSVRLLPPRRTWESALFAETDRLTNGASAPSPLQVLAALGDERAADVLRRPAPEGGGPEDGERVARIARERGAELRAVEPASLHVQAVSAIEDLVRPADPRAPPFARTDAWRTFVTWEALGSWACLRHPFELHSKPCAIVFGGPVIPPGYVAPCPSFFDCLARVVDRAGDILERYGAFRAVLPEQDPGPFTAEVVLRLFRDLGARLRLLAGISRKQLDGAPLDGDETNLVARWGDSLAEYHLFLDNATRDEDFPDDLPFCVRAFSDRRPGAEPRERYVAVGRAMEVFVIRWAPREIVVVGAPPDLDLSEEVVIPAGLRLYRGGTFAVYELDRPVEARFLTDGAWKDLLDAHVPPGFPPWTRDFLVPGGGAAEQGS